MRRSIYLISCISVCIFACADNPDIFSVYDNESLTDYWKIRAINTSITIDPEFGGSCILLSGEIKKNGDKLYWDWEGQLDLSQIDVIHFSGKMDHTSGINSIGFYFGTASGWFANYKIKKISSDWEEITLHTKDFIDEGSPKSWGKITKFRVSVWGSDAGKVSLYLKTFEVDKYSEYKNYIKNGSFEIPGPLPYGWGSGHWGVGDFRWAEDMEKWRSHFMLDYKNAVHGNVSLRLVNSLGLPLMKAISCNFTAELAKNIYSLSVWMKSDCKSGKVAISCGNSSMVIYPTEEWKLYKLDGILLSKQGTVKIEPQSIGVFWIDAVQVQKKGSDSQFFINNDDDDFLVSRESRVSWEEPNRSIHIPLTNKNETISNSEKVEIDLRGNFVVGGKPYFQHSIGFEYIEDLRILDVAVNAGFKDVCIMINPSDDAVSVGSYLDYCNRIGLMVIPWFDRKIPLQIFRDYIEVFKNHPALLCWYVFDEPNRSEELEAKKRLNIAHEIDPQHPAYINYLRNQLSNQIGDIYSTDIYPIPYSNPLEAINGVDRMVVDAKNKNRPVWIWLQGTGYAYNREREPTPLEISCMAYGSIIRGARGIMWFAQIPRSRECWNEMKALCFEIKQLLPILFVEDDSEFVTIDSDDVISTAFQKEGEWWIVAVNTKNSPIKAKIRLQDNMKYGEVFFEGRSIYIKNNYFDDNFEGYERHVYRLYR